MRGKGSSQATLSGMLVTLLGEKNVLTSELQHCRSGPYAAEQRAGPKSLLDGAAWGCGVSEGAAVVLIEWWKQGEADRKCFLQLHHLPADLQLAKDRKSWVKPSRKCLAEVNKMSLRKGTVHGYRDPHLYR